MIEVPHLHFGAVRRSGDIVLDVEKQNNASATSDVLLEFHKKNFQICSLLGCESDGVCP